MEVYTSNPLTDSRWNDLVSRHPHASAFHHAGWLQALAATYGYEPLFLTTAPPGEALHNGIVLCKVTSWITGTRMVSLPFSDHCAALLQRPEELELFADWLRKHCGHRYRYIELRSFDIHDCQEWKATQSFWFHQLDLSPTLAQLFESLHKDSIQRKIRRAEKENLICETGRSSHYLDEFYRLLLKTRRRHQLLPQPRSWFANVLKYGGDRVDIRLVRKDGSALAAMLTLRHRSSVIYKYGCSDQAFHQLGVMPFLFWKLIEESKAAGIEEIDFGRSDFGQDGLVAFKDKFGTRRRQLTYYRHACHKNNNAPNLFPLGMAQRFFPVLPDIALTIGGRLLYRHIG